MNRTIYTRFLTICLAIVFVFPGFSEAQNKKKPSGQKQPQQQSKPKQQAGTQVQNKTVIKFTPEELESFRQQSSQMVKFFEGTLNFLADKSNPVKERQVIITQSYLKFFWDPKVQVEDDLDENRQVTLYKDIPAYLTDVDFFFKSATFRYDVQDVNIMTNEIGQTYFKVTANRTLAGITVSGDSVRNNKVRYFEINYDDQKQQVKIVSIYTTKINENDDMRNWWNGLSDGWKTIFGKSLRISDDLTLAQVQEFNDSTATVNFTKVRIDGARVYPLLLQIINQKTIDITGNSSVSSLEPLSKLSSLKEINISGTPVNDLMPLRNLNELEMLNCSGTSVTSLEPLRYANKIKELHLNKTQIHSISMVSSYPNLEFLDISNSPVDSLDALKELTGIRDVQCQNSQVKNLEALSGKENLEFLNCSGAPVTDLGPLKSCKRLKIVFFSNTKVGNLEPLGELPDLTRIYCDNTPVNRESAMNFMQKYPGKLVIFESEELTKWWNGMSPEWQKVFQLYRQMNDVPSKEQLHELLAIDSINVNGRIAISTLAPVENLVYLRHLECANTAVADLVPLKSLIYITVINADNSKITSLQPLSGLKNLETLSINNTAVSDLAPLKELKELKMIYADNTGVNVGMANGFIKDNPDCLVIFQTYENTNWWKNLSQAWKDVFLGQAGLSGTPDKVQLQKIVNLEKVVINENLQINSLGNLLKLSRLNELQFSGTAVTSLEPAAQMSTLRILRFPKNPISDLTPIAQAKWLKEIDFSNTPVEELEPIQFLTGLEVLKFSGTQVKNLKYIQNMTSLQTVEAYNTRISSLDYLENVKSLKMLKIFNTKISEKKVQKFRDTHPGCEVVYY